MVVQIIPQEMITVMTDLCLATDSCDAVKIADRMMACPEIRMHGPEHHFLVAAAILTAYTNRYCPDSKYKFLKMAALRTIRIPVAVCALYGTCGALMGAGAAVSIITLANPFVPDSLQLVNRVTAAIQNELCGYAGIRCCKRAVWASVRGTVCTLGAYGGPELELSDIHCRYAFTHNACIGENCPYCVSGSGQVSRNC
jgi:hypothetical protein